jgi:hypothetical protein
MSVFTKQILRDTTTEVVVKFTGIVDAGGMTSDLPNTTLIMSQLRGAYDTNGALISVTGGAALPFYQANIRQVHVTAGSTIGNSSFNLTWVGSSANVDGFVMPANGQQDLDLDEGLGQISWNAVGQAGAGAGNLQVTANGVQFGTYTFIVVLRKNPGYFDRGALIDKSYFRNP